MSRSVTADTVKRLDRPGGEAPLPVVKLFIGSQVFWFSDRELDQDGLKLDGRIQKIGALDTSCKFDHSSRVLGSVGVIEVVLLDEDQVMLDLMDANDLQGIRAEVYHWYEGQTQADLMLLLKGRIEAPPTWLESDRTLKITIETPRRLKPIPFSPTEADGLLVDLDHLGKVWPMAFGTPSDVPAVLVRDAPRGTLTRDMTQDGVIDAQTVAGIPNIGVDVPTTVFEIDNPDEDFPQGNQVVVKIADEYVTGSFHNNTLTVTRRQINKYTGIRVGGNGAIVTVPAGVRAAGFYIVVRPDSSVAPYQSAGIGATGASFETQARTALAESPWIGTTDASAAGFVGYCYKQIGTDCYILNGSSLTSMQNVVADINRYPYSPAQGARWTHKAGTTVVVQSVKPLWIANQIPSTSVLRVRAWRQVTSGDQSNFSQRKLVNVPKAIYTVNLSNSSYNGATTVTMNEMLSDREAGWEDEIFVTMESTVGSNTATAIKYLIDNHSEGKLTTDATSFAAVAAAIAAYPSNFAITTQGDVLDICGDIAWQARCGVRWDGSAASIVYLSKEPFTEADNLNDARVAEGSVALTTTRMEDIVTVFNVTWQPNYSDRKPHRIMLQTNVARYGKREANFDFWIYQKRSLVAKSATFWSRRMGRVWRMATTETWGLEGLPVTVLDYVKWLLPDFYSTVRGLVTEADWDDDHVEVEAMLPIEAGTVVQSSYFWMSDSGDVAPSLPDYDSGTTDNTEIITTLPPEEINQDLKPVEQRPVDTEAAAQVYSVVATVAENKDPASRDWKKVWVFIRDPREITLTKTIDGIDGRLAQIAALDPSGLNYTLNAEKLSLLAERADTLLQRDRLLPIPNPLLPGQYNSTVYAHNPSVSYMQPGDTGTMIFQNQEYVVSPDGSTGPFIAKVNKEPHSPAEGVLWADSASTVPTPMGTGTKQIKVLGDGAGIKVGDTILVFRDANGDFYTPGGGFGGSTGYARVVSNASDKTAVPIYIWRTGDPDGDPDEFASARCPGLGEGFTLAEGTEGIAIRLSDRWVFITALVTAYVP